MTHLRSRVQPGALGGLLALAVALLFSASASAQDATLTGTVLASDTGEPLIGAALLAVDAGRGAATDLNGAYRLEVPAGTYTFRVSYTGYEPQEATLTLQAGQTLTQSFTLDPDLAGLEEVVVTGALSSRSRSR